MLDNRDYMRARDRFEVPGWQRWPARVWLMITLAVVFFLDKSDFARLHSLCFKYLELSVAGIKHGYVWQFLTFQFLHAGLQHLAGNLIVLWMISRTVENALGKSRYLKLFLMSGAAGGLLQFCLMAGFSNYGSSVVGASAGICGLLAAFALIDPDAIVLVQFLFPLRAIYLLYLEAAWAVFSILVPSGADHTANAAHLGGMLFGVAYMKLDWQRFSFGWPAGWFQRKTVQRPRGSAPVPEGIMAKIKLGSASQSNAPKEFISSEVDPILDKISAHGIQSLTDRERKILQSARAKMSKR